MDFSNYRFACSQIYNLMSNGRAKWSEQAGKDLDKLNKKIIRGEVLSPQDEDLYQRRLAQQKACAENKIILSEGTKKLLKEIYLSEAYGSRYKLLSPFPPEGVPQMVRGIKTEANCLELLRQVDGCTYFKYKKPIHNDWLTGILDVLDAADLKSATKIFDIKSSSSAESFFCKKDAPFTKQNKLQMQGYLAITGKEVGEITHCLVGYSEETISEQYQLLKEKMCQDGIETLEFLHAWSKAENDMRYSYLAPSIRVVGVKVNRDEDCIAEIYDTISVCREWLNQYHKDHQSFKINRYIETTAEDNS